MIRKGIKADLPRVLELIRELAVYEKAPDQVDNTVERMETDGFGERPVFEFFVSVHEGDITGIALYYFRYSTWKGKCIHLEDLVVRESERGKGTGKALFDAVVSEAKATGSRLVTWQVLDWNEPAIRFYKRLNAHFDGEWINCKLTHEQILDYSTD